MKLNKIYAGTKLEIAINTGTNEKKETSLISEFEWAESENTAYIAAPILEGVLYPIRSGTVMKVYFIEKDAFYCFKARVKDRNVKDNIALLKIEVLNEIEKLQRRQFFRLDCSIALRYWTLEEDSQNSGGMNAGNKGILSDLSGGGACIIAGEKLEKNKIIQCEFSLDDKDKISLFGEVVRSDRCDGNDTDRYKTGIEFKRIDNKYREAIIRFIFNEQRKLRKKGLI